MNRVEHTPEATLKATQIIAAALMAGVVSTVGMVVFLVNNEVIGVNAQGTTISQITAGLTVVSLFLLAGLSGRGIRSGVTKPLHEIWQQRMVVRFALLEGTALLNAVACLVERQWWSFALLVAVLVLMGMLFPTRTRFEHFIETHTSFS